VLANKELAGKIARQVLDGVLKMAFGAEARSPWRRTLCLSTILEKERELAGEAHSPMVFHSRVHILHDFKTEEGKFPQSATPPRHRNT
jgi:hypothetical protein